MRIACLRKFSNMEHPKICFNQPLSREDVKEIILECLALHNSAPTPKDYSKKEFAELTGKSISWLDAERRKGQLEWYKIGGAIRIPHSEYTRLTNQQ